tara:strand:+ start:13142 stop:14182 length:1041 start_codon:yes stop_codon:yes gene_type:complete
VGEEHVAKETWRVSPDPMCILSKEGTFIAVNPAFPRILGWTAEEMTGAPYLDFLHPDDMERSLAAFEQVTAGQPVLRFENRYRTKAGDYRWFSWVAVPEDERIYCTIRDMTDDKAREELIVAQRQEAELREQFLAILGHDLRNPLSAFSAGVRLLQREDQSERAQRVLVGMRESSLRMAELVANMMDFARVRLGDGIGLNIQHHDDLDDQIGQVIDEIDMAFPHLQIDLTTDLPERVKCDASRLMQVLSNLLGNAVTHGASGEPIRVSAVYADGELRIAVRNAGEPIPDDVKSNLFQPFLKGEPHSSPQGLGLGLYISSQIVEAHGGQIEVASSPEETRFEVQIPA